LITIYLAGAKNTDSWHARKEDLQRDSPLHVPMVPSPKLSFIANDNNPTGVGLAQGNTIDFGGLEFIADRFGHLSLSPSGEELRCHVHRNGPQWVTFSRSPLARTAPPLVPGAHGIPRAPRMQCGDLDGPHHHHTSPGGHSCPPIHPDGHGVNRGAPARNGEHPRSIASLPGGGASAIPCPTDRCQAMGSSAPR
jgi:hypothetical protein